MSVEIDWSRVVAGMVIVRKGKGNSIALTVDEVAKVAAFVRVTRPPAAEPLGPTEPLCAACGDVEVEETGELCEECWCTEGDAPDE